MATKEKELSLAESRPRRALAGRNIGKLIDQEQDGDDFYKSAYGGFEEESADEEYEEEDSEDDVVDSDFDVDESTWHMDEEEGDEQLEEKKKKKQWIKPTKPKAEVQKQAVEELQVQAPRLTKPKISKPKKQKTTTFAPMDTGEPSEQRSLRKSTLVVSKEFRKRMQEEEELRKLQRSRKMNVRKKPLRKLTQSELLEEAKRTERENLASLEAYARLEAEKKKVKEKVNIIQGPFIRFHSITMPLISEFPDPVKVKMEEDQNKVVDIKNNAEATTAEQNINTENPLADKQSALPGATKDLTNLAEPQKYSRNFLIFTDTLNYPSGFFPSKKPRRPKKRFCPITGLPAKYMDPVTGTPYATAQAFRVIRNRYISEGEQKCEKRLLQLSNWLEEKKRKKLEGKAY